MQTSRLLALPVAVLARDLSRTCSVTEFGADASGNESSTAAIQSAIDSCGRIIFPEGRYLHGTLQMLNDTVVEITSAATLLGAALDSGEYLAPEDSPWSHYQDYGHSGWSDAMFYGRAVRNVTISGGGVVDGNGGLSTAVPPAGGGCRMFSFVDSEDVAISGPLTLRNGGWFTMIFTNCQGLRLADFTVFADRDGIDLMQSRDVLVEGITIQGGHDDALKFGSDWSRGRAIDSFNVHVRNSTIGSNGVDAVVVGTETVGDFYNFTFENLTLTNGTAGIGLTSYDGANIFNFSFRQIRMMNLASPFYFAVYARLRRPEEPSRTLDERVGSVRDITVRSVSARSLAANWSTSHGYSVPLCMLEGLAADAAKGLSAHPVGPGLDFRDLELHFPDRGSVAPPCLDPSQDRKKYPQVNAPAYAWFVRHATGVAISDASIGLAAHARDARPAIVVDNSSHVMLTKVAADRSEGSSYDLEVRHSTAVQLFDASLTEQVDPCNGASLYPVV